MVISNTDPLAFGDQNAFTAVLFLNYNQIDKHTFL